MNPSIFLYSANFVFILTNLYCWTLKVCYRAEPYSDNYGTLFPSQRSNGELYLWQVFEIPYLWMLPDPKALFYVNAFSVLLFSSWMGVTGDRSSFLQRKKRRHSLPVVLIALYLLLAALEVLPATANTYRVMFWIVTAVSLYYIARWVMIRRNIRRSIRAVDTGTYSHSDAFPVRYARRIIGWVPITLCLLMFVCFALNDSLVKMWRNWLFTVVNVSFLLYSLNQHRRGSLSDEKPAQGQEEQEEQPPQLPLVGTNYKLSPERCREIEQKLIELIEKERLFLDCHLTLDRLSQKAGVNRNYLSEAIARSTHGSFYALVNCYRVACAQEMLRRNPTLKIEHIAYDSGFSTAATLTNAFKRYTQGMTPAEFAKALLTHK